MPVEPGRDRQPALPGPVVRLTGAAGQPAPAADRGAGPAVVPSGPPVVRAGRSPRGRGEGRRPVTVGRTAAGRAARPPCTGRVVEVRRGRQLVDRGRSASAGWRERYAPRFAASITPGPPPVMTSRPARASSQPSTAVCRYAGAPRSTACPPITPTTDSGPCSATQARIVPASALSMPWSCSRCVAPRGPRASRRRGRGSAGRRGCRTCVEAAFGEAGRQVVGGVELRRLGRVRQRDERRHHERAAPDQLRGDLAGGEPAADEEGVTEVDGGQVGRVQVEAQSLHRQAGERAGGEVPVQVGAGLDLQFVVGARGPGHRRVVVSAPDHPPPCLWRRRPRARCRLA